MGQRTLFFGAAAAGLMLIGYGSGFAQVAWQQVLHFIALEGKPVAASPPLVSEHELQELARMTPQQQAERTVERARSDFDRGHFVTAVFSYPLPVGHGKRFLPAAGRLANGFLGGWQLSGTVTAASGQALTVQDSTINANIGESTRPNRIASGKDVTGSGTRGLDYPWFDPAAFVPVPSCASRTNCSPDASGFYPFAPGNAGRNILDGPGLFYTNTTRMKNFRVREGKSVQVRYEVFNLFNHPSFQLPDRNFDESAAGIISGVQGQGRGGPRVMQFALKYTF